MSGPKEPTVADLPSSPSEAFALGWSMAWADKRIMRCPIKDGNYTGDDDLTKRALDFQIEQHVIRKGEPDSAP